MMIAGVFALGTAFPLVGIFFHLWGKYFRQIAAFQLVNLIKKIILEPPTPTEAALVGIAH